MSKYELKGFSEVTDNTSNLTGVAFYRICNIYGQTKAAEVWTLTVSSFPFGPKYFSQQSGFEHSQLVQFSQHGSPSITPLRNNRENYSVLYFNTYVCRQVMGKKSPEQMVSIIPII